MKALPDGLELFHQTPDFENETIPGALQTSHQTKDGVWGKIVVEQGELIYRILQPEVEENHLSPSTFGVVEPTVPHEVEPVGEVKFHVEFYR